ncbi:flagellar hook-length control protein FliK [Billgrantia saliphila]|uniref:flagellar hook-length control protein FliK n=1 Tax=Billgrantia saliphila TaxID=1848458 RepID=UPI000CE4D65C|nr:flagellar hook-length control protein FliK [Halomonas saliphila]
MNIQMILAALPTQPTGKLEPGLAGQSGPFALALANAGSAAHAASGESVPVLENAAYGALPSTMAAHQTLLQALDARLSQADGESGSGGSDALLDEIMARLALIEETQQWQSGATDAALPNPALLPTELSQAGETPLPDAATDAVALVSVPMDVALKSQGAAERNPAPLPGVTQLAEMPANADTQRVMTRAEAANPLLAGATPARDGAEAATRSTELASTRATSLQPNGIQANGAELRAASDASRGGFVPESASLAPSVASPGITASGAQATAPMPAQTSLSAPLQSPAWPGQLGQQLVQFARHGGEQRIEMHLHPAELGPLSVTLKVTEQGAQAQFLSAHALVRQVIEQAIPQLRESLAEQGISLGETSVGDQRQRDAQAFAGNGGQQSRSAPGQGDDAMLMGDEGHDALSTQLSLDGRVNLYA